MSSADADKLAKAIIGALGAHSDFGAAATAESTETLTALLQRLLQALEKTPAR